MAIYQYRAADHAGKIIEGAIEADGQQRVVAKLHEMGLIPLRVAEPGAAASRTLAAKLPIIRRDRVHPKQLLHFTQELSTLLAAGLPLDRSLSILAQLAESEKFRKVVAQLLEGVRAGRSLSAAMAEHPQVFPKLYVNMVRAGESGGVLESVLKHLTEYLQRSVALREELKAVLTYPVVVMLVAGVSLTTLFLFVIPKFALLFEDVYAGLPLLTKALLGFSSLLSRFGWLALVVLLAVGAAVALHARSAEGRMRWDRLRLNFWLVGDLVRKLEVARFSRTLSALLHGGVPLLDALGTVQGVVTNGLIARAIQQVQTRVREGKGMARPLSESGIFPPLALHMIAVGEETGRMEVMLSNVADHYEEEVRRAVQRLTSLLEPALILAMAVVIGVVVLSMLLAILTLYDLPM